MSATTPSDGFPDDPAARAVPASGSDGDQTGENVCPECGGEGVVDGAACRTCLGTGRVVEPVGDA